MQKLLIISILAISLAALVFSAYKFNVVWATGESTTTEEIVSADESTTTEEIVSTDESTTTDDGILIEENDITDTGDPSSESTTTDENIPVDGNITTDDGLPDYENIPNEIIPDELLLNKAVIRQYVEMDVYNVNTEPDRNSGQDYLAVKNNSGTVTNAFLRFNIPDSIGDIKSVKLYLFNVGKGPSKDTANYIEAHRLLQTNWTEDGLTWKTYDGIHEWDNPGGDYDPAIIGQTALKDSQVDFNDVIVLMGDGAINPMEIFWKDEVNLMLKMSGPEHIPNVLNSSNDYFSEEQYSDENDSLYPDFRPYLEISYVPQ